MQENQRSALCQMLEDSRDFPQNLLYLYRRRQSPYTIFIASRGDGIEGVLTGSFDSDFSSGNSFDSFELPPAPHAFLERIHVRESGRYAGVGRALIKAYADAAFASQCTFIGGSLDLSSDPAARTAFFTGLGFEVRALDNFGASPTDVLRTYIR